MAVGCAALAWLLQQRHSGAVRTMFCQITGILSKGACTIATIAQWSGNDGKESEIDLVFK
jgi:hypothetical protein